MATRTAGARSSLSVLVIGSMMAAASLLTAPGVASAQSCTLLPLDPDCQSSTTVDEPAAEVTSTTEARATTTTTERATVTTAARSSATTAGETATTTTVETVTTVSNLLVPGDGTDGAESTTTTVVGVAPGTGDGGLSDGTLIALVIAGLLLIALVVSVLTWRYWVATRPPVLDDGPAPDPGRTAQASVTPPLRSG